MRKIIIYGIMIFIFSIMIGYLYSNIWKSNKEEVSLENQTELDKVVSTISTEEKVSYDASFCLKKHYNGCGHVKIMESELPKEIINLTKKELNKLYYNWKVEKFKSDEIVLSKEEEGICDDHYVLKMGDENIEAYRLDGKGETRLYKTTNISKEYLTNQDIYNLEEGIYVYGIKELNSAIEDFE